MLETKEHGSLPWPGSDVPPGPDLATARAALAAEWQAVGARTPQDIHRFYETAQHLGLDLEAWHALPDRQSWTAMLVSVAQQSGAHSIVDIGCGAGHDLRALREALPQTALAGVEPNARLRAAVLPCAPCVADVADALIETADLLICIDVLEHVPDPETFLSGIATRAPVGCLLFETTATADTRTPLHLPANRGWHPGRCLEQQGWEVVDRVGRVRVWRRAAAAGRQRAGLLLCAYRSVNAATLESILATCAGPNPQGWRLRAKTGDGMISRSRGILTTAWWRECNDDVALFIDDDVAFDPADAHAIVERCRAGHDIICGAYPVHSGAHLAVRLLPETEGVDFGPDHPPIEIQYAATGFLAIHRRVLDALVPTLPLMHADQPWSYYNLFPFLSVTNETTGCAELLSEDWGFCALARRAGFAIWLDPTIILRHASTLEVSVRNMGAVSAAIAQT
jgi:SAM-dependent methyltransferase